MILKGYGLSQKKIMMSIKEEEEEENEKRGRKRRWRKTRNKVTISGT